MFTKTEKQTFNRLRKATNYLSGRRDTRMFFTKIQHFIASVLKKNIIFAI